MFKKRVILKANASSKNIALGKKNRVDKIKSN